MLRISKTIDGPFSFQQLRTLESLKVLINQLKHCDERFLIFALLWCRLQFFTKADDQNSLDGSRGYACEIAAMRILRRYNSKELLQVLTSDYQALEQPEETPTSSANGEDASRPGPSRASATESPFLNINDERTPLRLSIDSPVTVRRKKQADLEAEPLAQEKIGARTFTAMEVAIVAEAKHFIASQIVQDMLSEIWNGEIVFWSDISQYEYKKARFYDPSEREFWDFARLRVPKYHYLIEWINFVILAGFYMAVVVDREDRTFGWLEIVLATYFLGFAYSE